VGGGYTVVPGEEPATALVLQGLPLRVLAVRKAAKTSSCSICSTSGDCRLHCHFAS
jgi:hypothetical protein